VEALGKNGEALEKICKALEKFLHRHRKKIRLVSWIFFLERIDFSFERTKESLECKRIRSDALQPIVPSICQAGVPCISVSLLVSFVVSQLPC
jgi:hypothetical protein